LQNSIVYRIFIYYFLNKLQTCNIGLGLGLFFIESLIIVCSFPYFRWKPNEYGFHSPFFRKKSGIFGNFSYKVVLFVVFEHCSEKTLGFNRNKQVFSRPQIWFWSVPTLSPEFGRKSRSSSFYYVQFLKFRLRKKIENFARKRSGWRCWRSGGSWWRSATWCWRSAKSRRTRSRRSFWTRAARIDPSCASRWAATPNDTSPYFPANRHLDKLNSISFHTGSICKVFNFGMFGQKRVFFPKIQSKNETKIIYAANLSGKISSFSTWHLRIGYCTYSFSCVGQVVFVCHGFSRICLFQHLKFVFINHNQ